MPDYDFSNLSSRSFEQMVQALALKVIGPGVMVFGDGPDGGREATFEGRFQYPSTEDGWDGHGVIQAKFLQRSRNSTWDGQWAVDQLKSELEKYLEPDSSRKKPDYYILATNVVLTPATGNGSKDKVNAVFDSFKEKLPLKGFAIWDYDQIRSFLDDNEDIRHAYSAWITSGDVLAELVKRLQPAPPNFEETLSIFLQKELLSDEYVNLEQAGHDANERIHLARVFVDLHTQDEPPGGVRELEVETSSPHHIKPFAEQHNGFIKEILEVSSERLNSQSHEIHTIAQSPETGTQQQARGRFVLIGGPGQGKTTVGQFICQIFRASIISRRLQNTLSPETIDALSMIQTHCDDEDIDHFPVPRFPFRIVLNEFASALSATSVQGINSVFSYLAHHIGKRTDREISADDIRQWIGQYPSVIIFDGLDEVPSSSNREQLLASIREFWVDASNYNADILAIATSRPQGYNEDFSPAYYQHRWLVPLSKELGRHFATRLVNVRYGTDSDRKDKVLARLERSFDSESTSRLMRTPLQVTIMTALVDRMGQPPQARWNLFKAYYDVVYQREVERDIPASDLLRYYEPDINVIHSRVGLLLQVDSEQSGKTDAKFSSQRFRTLVEKRLKEEGHKGHDLNELAGKIFDAALERLVFLVGLESDQIGFEIRSLQEFMAAESLMEGSDQDIARRLKEIAPIPNWRNVFLFASGKCFAERQHLRDSILSMCLGFNEAGEDEIASTFLVGSDLAIDLIEDGLARHQPKFVQSFARIATRALDVPNPGCHLKLSSVYEPQLEDVYSEEIERRLSDVRDYVKLGAWDCLVHLVEAQIEWAQKLAEKYWPSDPEDQIEILNHGSPTDRNRWVMRKLLEVAPQISLSKIPEFFRVPQVETQDLSPEQETCLEVLGISRRHYGAQVSFLGTRLHLPVLQVSQKEFSWLSGFQNLKDCDPSWTAYKLAATFVQEPSKQSLASALKAIAPLLSLGFDARTFRWRSLISWPILACLEMCTDESQLVELASKAAAGRLGDVDDWVAAENRWIERGITLDDIHSMSDERLPFDGGIAISGYPTTLNVWSVSIHGDHVALLGRLSTIHSQFPKCKSRSFIARMFESCLFHASFIFPHNEQKDSGTLNAQSLISIYEDIEPDSSIPLSVVIGQIGGTSQEITAFFAAMADRQVRGHTFLYHHPLDRGQVGRLCQAFQDVSDNSALLPAIGWLAQDGYLANREVRVPAPDELESTEQKIAALITLLAKESWETDKTGQFLEWIQELSQSSEWVCNRVITTIRQNRPSGAFADKFFAKLETILPQDDYETRMSYIYLLEDCLSRRVSKFADPNQLRQLNMPQGIIELLPSG